MRDPRAPACVLMPGMDGTGLLFRRLVQGLGQGVVPWVVSYPSQELADQDALLSLVERQLPTSEPFFLVAESFSGPLAVRLAARKPPGLTALVLVATFITSPAPALFSPFAGFLGLMAALPLPELALRWFLVGTDAPADLVAEVSAAIRTVRPGVLASRLRQILAVDVTDDASRCTVPTLYLQATRDRLVSARAEATLRRFIPHAVTRVLDGPHLLLQRRPVEAAQEIRRFARLERLTA